MTITIDHTEFKKIKSGDKIILYAPIANLGFESIEGAPASISIRGKKDTINFYFQNYRYDGTIDNTILKKKIVTYFISIEFTHLYTELWLLSDDNVDINDFMQKS